MLPHPPATRNLLNGASVPAGVVTCLALLGAVPSRFPHNRPHSVHNDIQHEREKVRKVQKIDFPGAVMLLAATILLCTAFEQAGIEFAWRSGFVISLLTISGLLWITFICWERYVTHADQAREPVFPLRFLQRRDIAGLLL